MKSREREKGAGRTEHTVGFPGLKRKGHTASKAMRRDNQD